MKPKTQDATAFELFQAHFDQIGAQPEQGPFAKGHRIYHYYPSNEVYFDTDRSIYFWQTSTDQWTSGHRLPFSFRLNSSERETIHLTTAYPTRFHTRVRMVYPSGSMLTTVESDH